MAIDSKNQLVWVKAMARGQALPLDASEVWESKAAAETYAAGIANSSSVAYVGQTLKVVEDGVVTVYVITDATGTLTQVIDSTHSYDDRYYTETEIDEKLQPISEGIDALEILVGDKKVSDQISEAIDGVVFPVSSVNGKTGSVQLTASDVGALSSEDEILSERVVHGSEKTQISNIIDTYILTIDYEKLLAFNTAEIVIDSNSSGGDIDNEDADTSAVLGKAVLGQMVLG